MTIIRKSLLAAGIAFAALSPIAAAPAAAQVVKGIGVVSLPAVVANSNAYKVAEQQRPVTYKPQLDQAEARRAAIAAQLQPLVTKFNTDRQANPNNPALQQQAAAIQQIQQSGQQELQQLVQPIALSQAYVTEQIEDKLDTAVQNAAKKKNVQLILDPTQGAVLYADAAYNMTQDVLNELNVLLPSAQLVPPQGWVPRQVRAQQEAAAAANGQAAPTTPPAASSR
ncbi:Outer membrane protein (OmpH-like) [Tsuneonella dongtanensis]|uniref:Outer membrane protein (OmpH-like) n=1 Tax=Tsuneonella dongtanensis TaxID=692370 RepID=A0A1B2AGA1_9SPHN|nr:OmpH family outer membrane protein [Tsuneonella dongtanensis]ANY21055.1 Outer membrane protein (OmpH-like) [Tsuneonella dongtanensis]